MITKNNKKNGARLKPLVMLNKLLHLCAWETIIIIYGNVMIIDPSSNPIVALTFLAHEVREYCCFVMHLNSIIGNLEHK